ncbi:toxin YdaT family protein [Photobacterium toruni]|uniref:Toxin YdaT family protein n=1 Tax=Photobacterium toruni TaxID=1935446 RepID=A0ABU6L4L4_9GAMM|nr:toxin YdaT family protein [Photobacterium toruni]
MSIQSLKSVMRNAVEGWRTEVSKEFIAQKVARQYHNMDLPFEVDAQRKQLLKPVGADDKNNQQNFFRYLERTSVEAKATMMDLLPAILVALPKQRASDALNAFLNPLGFSVAVIGTGSETPKRDQLLAMFNKESSEALSSLLLLPDNATVEQLRAAYREVQESEGSHKPLLGYLETLMTAKNHKVGSHE